MSETLTDDGTHISVYQYRKGELIDLCVGSFGDAENTVSLFERLGRIWDYTEDFPPDGGVLVELTANWDLDDRKLVLTSAQGEWLLDTFLKVPKSHWKRKLKRTIDA